jgi:hypothetical protein
MKISSLVSPQTHTLVLFAFAWALFGTVAPLAAAEPPSLNEHLQPLKFCLGTWNVHWTDPDGKAQSGKATVKADAGGSIVTARFEMSDEEGKPVFTRVEVFFWQAETKCLAEVYFDSLGMHGSNVLVAQTPDSLLWQGGGYGGDGQPGHGTRELRKVDENRWTVRFLRGTHAGKAVPDSPKFTFTGAK